MRPLRHPISICTEDRSLSINSTCRDFPNKLRFPEHSLKIAVVYNEPKHTPAKEHWLKHSAAHASDEEFIDASEFGVLEQMESIAGALSEHGHDVVIFSADDEVSRLCTFLNNERPDAIFNCCESILGESKLEMNVAAMYELYGIEYTGSPAITLGMALNKDIAKAIFIANDVPTPRHKLFRSLEEVYSAGLRFPLITKPVHEDASIGIDNGAIVQNDDELRARVRFILEEFEQPALAEEFIDGRELNIGVIGRANGELQTLPVSEITFDGIPEGMPHIVSYEAKWVEDSPLYKSTVPVCPADLPPAILEQARAIALKAARTIGLRDYGRVDMRLDAKGNIFVLEANPNPDISEDAGFMRAASVSGRSYAGTINEIIELALERSKSGRR